MTPNMPVPISGALEAGVSGAQFGGHSGDAGFPAAMDQLRRLALGVRHRFAVPLPLAD
jgi:hypothetical protein